MRIGGARIFAASLALAAGLAAGGSCRSQCVARAPALLPGFLYGFSQGREDVVALSQGIGANAVRTTLSWRTIEPTLQVEGLSLDDVRDAQAVSSWAATRDWSAHDARIQELVDAGLYPVPIVGHGFSSTLPLLNGAPASPDALGVEEYLARQYRTTRAMVERYDGDGVDDAPGHPRVGMWQIENELNQAMLTAVFGWRDPTFFDALDSAWAKPAFLTRLLSVLRLAVEDADPSALAMTNLHSDVNAAITSFFGLPSWKEWLLDWRGLLDVVGLDAYPNYYRAQPPDGGAVGERVSELQELACDRPVMVIETGYPTGPAERGYDEASQAQYLEDAFQSAVAAGAAGFFWFGSHTDDHHDVEITQEDVDNLEALADAFEDGDVVWLLTFVLQNQAYVEGHLSQVIQSVEPYWGVVRPDGSKKPAWDLLVSLGQELP